MQDKPYLSALKRLESLPAVFTGSDLTTAFQWTSQTASTYLVNWRKAGLIQSLGGRSDVHMNLVRNRQANPGAALRRVIPWATLVGADVIREAGWTTQILQTPEVAVPQSGPLFRVHGFQLSARSDKWFLKTAPGTQDVTEGLRRLQPAWALADMIARALDKRVKDAWLLDPDDIELDEAQCDPDMPQALAAFNLRADWVTPQGYSQLCDELAAIQQQARGQGSLRGAR